MSTEASVAEHYTHGELEGVIRTAVEAMGKSPDALEPHDLSPVDEFHIGGRKATEHFAGSLGLEEGMAVLDVGSGLGGAARYFAVAHGCRVTGIDLTEEYVAVANTLAEWVGLAENVSYRQASALELPFEDESFDAATMLHVGMNIGDKETLFGELARVVRPGGTVGVYDVMRTGEGDLAFPVPWAANEETSFLASPEDYRTAAEAAGLEVTATTSRRDFAIEFFADLRKRLAGGGPPPLGLHLLMGADSGDKIGNMIRNIEDGLIAPTEIIAVKGS